MKNVIIALLFFFNIDSAAVIRSRRVLAALIESNEIILRSAIALSRGAAREIIIASLSLRACGITGEINGRIVAGEESTRPLCACLRLVAFQCQ